MEEEVWKQSPRYTKFEVSNKGRVRNAITKKLRKQCYDSDGYLVTGPDRVHTWVLEAFICLRPEGLECRHMNDVKDDNRLENLCWDTHARNMEDKWRNKIDRNTEEIRNLDLELVLTTKILIKTRKYSLEAISEGVGISCEVISLIKHKKVFKDL